LKAFIHINNTTVGYKKGNNVLPILSRLQLTFNEGDFIGIVGQNGSGKSTLLKSICGLMPPLHGEILIDSKNLNSYSLNELSKKISIVLTEKINGFNLKVEDVVAAGQMPYTNSFHQLKQEHLNVIENAINTVGINKYKNYLLGELSDGLFQKTMIAKALAQQSSMMLLDEPTAFLDFASKHELFLLLKKFSTQQHKCVMVSSHDLDLILNYCNKILIIHDGIAELLEVSKAKNNEAFKKIGGGYI